MTPSASRNCPTIDRAGSGLPAAAAPQLRPLRSSTSSESRPGEAPGSGPRTPTGVDPHRDHASGPRPTRPTRRACRWRGPPPTASPRRRRRRATTPVSPPMCTSSMVRKRCGALVPRGEAQVRRRDTKLREIQIQIDAPDRAHDAILAVEPRECLIDEQHPGYGRQQHDADQCAARDRHHRDDDREARPTFPPHLSQRFSQAAGTGATAAAEWAPARKSVIFITGSLIGRCRTAISDSSQGTVPPPARDPAEMWPGLVGAFVGGRRGATAAALRRRRGPARARRAATSAARAAAPERGGRAVPGTRVGTMEFKDYYATLGVGRKRDAGPGEGGVPEAGAEAPSGRQPRGPGGRGALQDGQRSLRGTRQSGHPPPSAPAPSGSRRTTQQGQVSGSRATGCRPCQAAAPAAICTPRRHVQLPRSVPKGSTRRSNATPRPDGAGPRREARPVIGRDEEIRRLAQRIVRGDVPEGLTDKRLAALDMGSLIAGAKYRGEFGRRCWSKPRGRRRGRTGAICSPNFGASRAGAARRRRSWRSPPPC